MGPALIRDQPFITSVIVTFVIIGPALFPVMAVSQGKPSASSVSSMYKKESVVRGHHIYRKSWAPVIGEVLPVEREEDNQHDDYAVAVMKNGDIVGHVPRSISRVSWFLLKRGGVITCQICGKRKHGVGLEVPCVYLYAGSAMMRWQLTRLLTGTSSCPSWNEYRC